MKNLKLAVAALLLSVSATMMAADRGEMNRPSQEERIGQQWRQIAAKLMLSDAQTEKLASTYADFCKEMKVLRPQHMRGNGMQKDSLSAKKKLGKRSMKRGLQQREQLSDAQIAKLTKQRMANQRRKIDIQEKYFDKFNKVLTARQSAYLINHVGRPHGMRQMGGMKRMFMKPDSMRHRQMLNSQRRKQG